MITELSQLDFNKQYTYSDYLSWRLTERVELIKGYLFRMTPAPTSAHQKISKKLTRHISNFIANTTCEMYYAPYDVRFYDLADPGKSITNVVQPDISIICDLGKIDIRGCLGAPDLIVEILSPSTSEKDLTYKYELYREHGVLEYWVVSPTEKTPLIYTLDESGLYQPSRLYVRSNVVISSVLERFSLDLSAVFEPFNWEVHDEEEKYYNRM